MKPPFLNSRANSKARPRSQSKIKPRSKKSSPKKRSAHTKRRVRAKTSPTKSNSSFFSVLTRYISIALILLLATGTILYIKRDDWGISSLIGNLSPAEQKPDPEKYTQLKNELESKRQQFKSQYLNSNTEQEKQQIINQASALLEDTLPNMMRCWLGHPWDFNGTATVPGEGKIACGYFVSVVMRDAGFKINRIRVAQQPSQNIIRTFVNTSNNYEIKTNTPYNKYLSHITNKYEGIHIVGLDKHVAFIVIKDGKMRFIHSGGVLRKVVDEAPSEAYALEHSNYRVISNISRNPDVIQQWILGIPFPTGGIHASTL